MSHCHIVFDFPKVQIMFWPLFLVLNKFIQSSKNGLCLFIFNVYLSIYFVILSLNVKSSHNIKTIDYN